LLPENSTTLLIDDKKNPTYFPDDMDEFSQSVLNHFSIWVVPHIPHSGIKSVEEARTVFPISSLFVNNIARKRNYTDSPLIQAEANGKVNQQSVFGRSYHSMWLASKPEELFRFQLVIWFSNELEKLYLLSQKAEPNHHVRSGQEWIGTPPSDRKNYLSYAYSSQSLSNTHWVIQIEESVLFSPVYKKHLWFQILTLIYFLISLFLSFALSRVLMQPVSILKNGLQELLKNRFPSVSSKGLHKEGKLVVDSFNTMSEALGERQRIAPYVPEALITAFSKISESQLLCSECVILVSDIRGFTSISESHAPEEVVALLNTYFSIWQEQVDRNQGIVIRYIGDAIIAVFLKDTSSNYLQDATETALAVSRRLRLWNQERRAMNQATIRNGCGLVMGELKLGIIGIESKREFLALGGMLERAEELEIQSKNASHSLVLCDELLMHNLKGLYDFVPVGNGYEIITKD
jgi:class 3 adenylate cyclase